MTVLTFISETPGFAGTQPRMAQMVCTNTLAEVTTAGFLNNAPNAQGQPKSNGDFVSVLYGVNVTGAGQFTGGTPVLLTMSIPSNSSAITLQVPTSDIPAYVQGITPGTSAANKAIVLDGSSAIDSVPWSAIESAAAITTAQVASVTTVSTTPASGSCAAQFQLKNQAGANIAYVSPIEFYVSTSAGVLTTAVTSVAALTNGVVASLVTGQILFATSNASGQIGITLTNAAPASYFVTFKLPNGEKSISSALVVNA